MAVPWLPSASCQTMSMSETWQDTVTRSPAWSTRSFCGMGKSGYPVGHWVNSPGAPVRTVSMPTHHSGNRAGSNSSFQTSSTGARHSALSANPGIRAPP